MARWFVSYSIHCLYYIAARHAGARVATFVLFSCVATVVLFINIHARANSGRNKTRFIYNTVFLTIIHNYNYITDTF